MSKIIDVTIEKNETETITVPEIKSDEILIVKVGSEEFPATLEDIRNVQAALSQAKADNNLAIVTHHAIDFVVIKRSLLDNVIIASNIDGLAKALVKGGQLPLPKGRGLNSNI